MPRFRPDDLVPLGISILVAAGATPEEARLVAEHEVAALVLGEENHGLELGTEYIEAIESGLLKPGVAMTIERESATTLLVNGNFNFGHAVSHHTMVRLIEKAQVSNVGVASIKYQCHVGRLIDYTSMAARAGMIGIMMTDGAWGPKFMAPHGGSERRLGVNPFSIALPSDMGGVVGFDMTSGTVSVLKIIRARDEGKPVPEEWILDRHGNPTTDPADFFDGGSVLPMGGAAARHKGYALNFMIEALADVLSGMEFRADPTRPWPIVDGCFMVVVNVEAFRPLLDFNADLRSFIEYVKSSAPAEGFAEVYYPGERSHRTAQLRAHEGVVIPPMSWERIMGYVKQYGLEASVPDEFEPSPVES